MAVIRFLPKETRPARVNFESAKCCPFSTRSPFFTSAVASRKPPRLSGMLLYKDMVLNFPIVSLLSLTGSLSTGVFLAFLADSLPRERTLLLYVWRPEFISGLAQKSYLGIIRSRPVQDVDRSHLRVINVLYGMLVANKQIYDLE